MARMKKWNCSTDYTFNAWCVWQSPPLPRYVWYRTLAVLSPRSPTFLPPPFSPWHQAREEWYQVNRKWRTGLGMRRCVYCYHRASTCVKAIFRRKLSTCMATSTGVYCCAGLVPRPLRPSPRFQPPLPLPTFPAPSAPPHISSPLHPSPRFDHIHMYCAKKRFLYCMWPEPCLHLAFKLVQDPD